MSESQILQIGDVFPQYKEIENLLSKSMKQAIAEKYGVLNVNKKHIQRAFSAALSGMNDLPDDSETLGNLDKLTLELRNKLYNQ